MKSILAMTILSVMTAVIVFSCKKQKAEDLYDPINSLYQTYTGKQGAGVHKPGSFLKLKMEDHGSLFTMNAADQLNGSGSWSIKANRFSGNFRQGADFVKISLSGYQDPVTHKIEGTWGYGDNISGAGSFYLEKEENKTLLAQNNNQLLEIFLLGRIF
ncbi:MAG: hypothetical protein EOO13_15515 [Chitinophagaceae bacterium]|nr:MAG: hypothetical protein EOO13_15515 [Chitinophagaceae bacterium]